VEHGAASCGKHPGEWFGPSATARCVQALSDSYPDAGLKVYFNGDGVDVYQDAVFKLAKSTGTFQPTLILLSIRLGIEGVTPAYWEALKSVLQLPQSVGIAGYVMRTSPTANLANAYSGEPSASHYFVGVQGDSFFFLDPHTTQPALGWHEKSDEYSKDEIDTCHTRRLRRLNIKSMDPSMLIAFLIKDEADWKKWRTAVTHTQGKPVVHVADAEHAPSGSRVEREGAVDEVETFDDDEQEEGDGELINMPPRS
jgi:cysteine protease ATG4